MTSVRVGAFPCSFALFVLRDVSTNVSVSSPTAYMPGLAADGRARGESREIPVFVPSLALSTDNAAMIAAAGLRRLRAGQRSDWALSADASLKL